ncbi:hypothetical protein DYB26_003282 [Aphanomyces astaci]|uniref:Peptidase M13 C-terminal domain-containing protein n=1 Tax=Aphanomyces astaci TaxID=112090 RepID=A0A3R6Z1X1_APHAT|nr:hypothetical protein DYB26_003282 [Aphanomyces astaci]
MQLQCTPPDLLMTEQAKNTFVLATKAFFLEVAVLLDLDALGYIIRMKDHFEVQGSILNRRTIINSPLRNAVTTLVPVIPLSLLRSVLELCHDSALHDIFMTKYTKEAGDELFYFSYEHAWCSKNTDASLLRSLWRHLPGQFRVTWALQSNAEYAEFARVFQCPTDSYFNPSKKCLLWE